MIEIRSNFFHIQTKNTSYVFSKTASGLLLHNYYGQKVDFVNFNSITQKLAGGFGTSVLYEGNDNQHMDILELEYSSTGIGDYRETAINLFNQDSGYSSSFKYQSYQILKTDSSTLPASYGENEVLLINLFDEVNKLKLELFYKIYSDVDVISRYAKLSNLGDNTFVLNRLSSLQLDFLNEEYLMMTFEGAWAKERHLKEKELISGIYINDSKTGGSSNRRNPLVILRKKNTGEDNGACLGLNMVYSGNHKTTIEVYPEHKLRLLMGINDHAFNFKIKPGSNFITPEAIMTYSHQGLNKLSQNFHHFTNNHIIRGKYKNQVRPVLINSWEAYYFNFDEKKLLKLAKAAKEVGIELFVMDDGWFGKRNNDTSSLGDWDVNYKKLPHGLKGFAEKIKKFGLDFGLWVEPEMINEDSNLYREHPDWVIRVAGRKPGVSRNQLVLDLTNPEVRRFLINKLKEVFSSCDLKYVKWDYNRNISDMYGKSLENQGEFFHRYILGFYEIMEELTKTFPDILFEGCASGGNRFDLGMLCYFPQIWTSDDTDYYERIYIQSGTSYGYPLSCMTNHVSDVPNHQTLRKTPLSSRYNLACFGNLGYELNLLELTKSELLEIKKQIKLYKTYREIFQYGTFYRGRSIFFQNNSYFYLVDSKQETAVLGFFQGLVHPILKEDIVYLSGLKEGLYKFKNKEEKINIKSFGGLINMVSPVKIKLNGKLHNFISRVYKLKSEKESYLISAEMMRYSGIRLYSQFMGTGYNDKVRVLGDFGSRIYFIEKIKEDANK
ncbi:MAG: alpha-galactosidase [Bacilli bacterium]|nr:alpha-galactosidase [Bacilli bacterium]